MRKGLQFICILTILLTIVSVLPANAEYSAYFSPKYSEECGTYLQNYNTYGYSRVNFDAFPNGYSRINSIDVFGDWYVGLLNSSGKIKVSYNLTWFGRGQPSSGSYIVEDNINSNTSGDFAHKFFVNANGSGIPVVNIIIELLVNGNTLINSLSRTLILSYVPI